MPQFECMRRDLFGHKSRAFLMIKPRIGLLHVACPVWTLRLVIERALKPQYLSIKDTPKRGILSFEDKKFGSTNQVDASRALIDAF